MSSVAITGGGSKISSIAHAHFEPSHFAISPGSHSSLAGALTPATGNDGVVVGGISCGGGVGSRVTAVASLTVSAGAGIRVGSGSTVAAGPGDAVATGTGVSLPPLHAASNRSAKSTAPALAERWKKDGLFVTAMTVIPGFKWLPGSARESAV